MHRAPGHTLELANPAFERTLGYQSRHLRSRPLLDFIHPEDRERSREAIAALARGEELVRFENRFVAADGSTRWLEWRVRPAPAEGIAFAVGRDMTDRRRAEKQQRRLADEQAALRRVATLVAEGATPTEVFGAVDVEIGRVLGADATTILRHESDGTDTVLAAHGTAHPHEIAIGARVSLSEGSAAAAVRRTGRSARIDGIENAPPWIAAALRRHGVRCRIAAPITVDGRLWGAAVAVWVAGRDVTDQTERRMAQFTDLVATAIANAEHRADLTASRARLVTAADEARRRIERDLHDGTQQRLVSLALAARAAEAGVPSELPGLRDELGRLAAALGDAAEELQDLARGIHPAILVQGGLAPALKVLARRSPVPVDLDLHVDRSLPEPLDVAAYFVVSEALTNAAKHAQASLVQVGVEASDATIDVTIRDDGVGGADPERGSGLVGLKDRVEALGGTIDLASAPGRGTTLHARLPLEPGEALASNVRR